MNGRIYDPDLGRFLQPDPVIQAPNNAQSWNAYTYVFNNPLRYTDPTGMIGIAERQWAATAFAIVYTYFTWDLQGGAAIAAAAAGGFVSGSIATGSWDGGIRGAFTAGLTAGIGMGVAGYGNGIRVGAMAMTGGVLEYVQGGSFGHAFVTAGLTAAVMPGVCGIRNDFARITVGALVGGTLSEMTGGKFANGAVTGAIMAAMVEAPKTGSFWGARNRAKFQADTTADQRITFFGKMRYKPAAGGLARDDAFKMSAEAWAPDSYRANRESNWYVVGFDDGTFGYTYPNVGGVGATTVGVMASPSSLIGRTFEGRTIRSVEAIGHNHLKGDLLFSGHDGGLTQSSSHRNIPLYLWNEEGVATMLNNSMGEGRVQQTYTGNSASKYNIQVTW